ncbi:MAG: phosphate signaling complex protein PhoU [Acidimicrobiia bacterium]|nr:phosphate signaling complex protein PhoU [Acidimicrobiia bacterium]
MTDRRRSFHSHLDDMVDEVVSMGIYARDMVRRAGAALVSRDAVAAEQVIRDDDPLDVRYLQLEETWLQTMALQTPVATDLRVMSVVLHSGHSVERIGDQAVSTAGTVRATIGLPSHPQVLATVAEIVDLVCPMVDTALDSLERRDLDLAMSVPTMGRPVERLERSMYAMVAKCREDEEQLEWAVRMTVVARNLGRVGARAVDIAEQVAFLLSGVFREFTSEDWGPGPADRDE